MNIGDKEWGFKVSVDAGRSELQIPVKDIYSQEELLLVLLETVHFLATLYGLLETPTTAEPKSGSYLN